METPTYLSEDMHERYRLDIKCNQTIYIQVRLYEKVEENKIALTLSYWNGLRGELLREFPEASIVFCSNREF